MIAAKPHAATNDGGEPEFTPASIRMLAASVVAQLLGGTMAIGLLPLVMTPISAGLGWSATKIGVMAGIMLIFAAIGLPTWGYLVDRYGPRPIVLYGAALTGFGLLGLAAQTGSLVQGGISFAVAGFLSATSVAHVKAQALRFDRSRGLVLAILGMTVGVSFGLTPLFGKIVLDAYGWRAVYAVFALLPLFVSLPVSFVWFRPERAPEQAGAGWALLPGGGPVGVPIEQAVRSAQFWVIVVLAAASAFVFAGMQANLVVFLGERGIGSQRAVTVLAIAVLGGLASQLLTGWMLDRWRTPRAAIPFVGVALLGMALLIAGQGPGISAAGVILLQSGTGGELSIIPYLVSRAFGGRHLARIFGMVMLIAQVLSGGSPVLMGMVHDRTGGYAPALPVFATLLVVSVVFLFLLGGKPRDDVIPRSG